MKKLLALTLCTLLVLATTGCGKKVTGLTSELPGELYVDESADITSAIEPLDASDLSLTYTSSDPAVATVDENGKVTAVQAGKVKITVQSSNKEVSAVLSLAVVVPVARVEAPAEISVPLDGTAAIEATALPEEAAHKEIRYTTADPAIATVDGKGEVTGIAVGETTITATTANSTTANIKVAVEIYATEITLDKDKTSLRVGEATTLTATLRPEGATVNTGYAWTSSDDKIATVDENGKVSAVGVGTATITARSETLTAASCEVQVLKKATASSQAGTTTGGAAAGGSAAGGASGGQAGTGGGPAPAPAGLTDADISEVVGAARAYAQGRGFTIVGGLQPSWPTPATIAGSKSFLISSVCSGVDYVYDYFTGDGDDIAGYTISIEYIVNGPAGTGIYVSY